MSLPNQEFLTTAAVSKRTCEMMLGVNRVKKSARNTFANYDYATADDVFDAIRPLLAKHQLEISASEVGKKIIDAADGKKWILFTYEIGFVGGTFDRRSVFVPLNNAQSMQAAATYAVKYWLRTKLLMSTGETDLDASGDQMKQPKKPPIKYRNIWSLRNGVFVEDRATCPVVPADSSDDSEVKKWKLTSQRDLYAAALRVISGAGNDKEVWEKNKDILKARLPKSGFDSLTSNLNFGESLKKEPIK